MKNKKIISLTAMSLVMGTTIATANADSLKEKFHNPVAVSEDIQAEAVALKSGDYASWKTAVENGGNFKILENINESNFAKYAEAFRLRESGDMDGSKAIMDALGIKEPERGGGMAKELELSLDDEQALELAVENADFDAWKTVLEKIKNDKLDEYLTEENFNIIVRAYKLQASGDRSGAMGLLDDANIPGFMLMFGDKKMHGGPEDANGADESKREALMAAYESGDYTSWKSLMDERGGGKVLEIVNAGNFAQFAKAKILQSEGKMSEAKEILDGLGFPFQERGERSMMQKPALATVAN
ncbi:MAG: hypothetical protein WCQ96_02820 [Patescibacteria group bacterium]